MMWRERSISWMCLLGILLLAAVGIFMSVRWGSRSSSEKMIPVEERKDTAQIGPNTPSERPAELGGPPKQTDLEVDLPLLKETEALVRWYSEPGVKYLEDAEFVWQKRANEYIEYLKKETFPQSAHRMYIISDLPQVMGNYRNFDPSNPDTIRIHARTRRFCKLIFEIEQAKRAGDLSSVIQTLSDTVERFIGARKRLEQKVVRLVEEKPELIEPGHPDNHYVPLRNLTVGFAVLPLDVANPENIIPMSLRGTQLGVLTHSFLLGLTEDSRAINVLLNVAAYDDEPFLQKVRELWGDIPRIEECSLANRWAVADALDRIIVANAGRADSSPAHSIAGEYVNWRSKRDWPARETMEIYPYDAPQTPYHLPSLVTGKVARVETKLLPLCLEVSRNGCPGLTNEDVDTILNWAYRYQEAL